ncbi:transcriptional protein SWT1-like [Elysia marginata]|uniref:Transcriptional protein SWT1-like n=1 Tax=Elysia marginata TaxID=1093978 RepID=A0AAV4G5A1_9GAST|nr:transcriptional protein SWT1-like [Elysia marginata]
MITGYGNPTFVLPWVVIQELDRLKVARKNINSSNQNLHLLAAAAVRFIHSQLKAKNPHVRGQTPQEENEETDLPIEMNDDKILHCCLQYQKKFPSSQLCLLTRDVNLRNKALIMAIDATDDNNLFSFLNVSNPTKKNGSTNLLKPVMDIVKACIFHNASKESTDTPMSDAIKEKRNANLNGTETENQTYSNKLKGNQSLEDTNMTQIIEMNLKETPSTNLHVTSSSVSSSTSSTTAVLSQQQVQPSTEHTSQIFAKFESVWKLVFDVNCLALSPVILHDHLDQFEKLCSALNFFFGMSGVVNTDPCPAVKTDAMVAYFKEAKNRVLLRSGLEQMESFSAEFMSMLKSMS